MNTSNDPEKMAIVSRLVKEGAIDFNEAMKLLESEQEFITVPLTYPSTGLPPWDNVGPWRITCYDKTNSPVIKPGLSTSVVQMSVDNLKASLGTYTNN